MDPVPSRAPAQAPVEMTRKRLWFLYQLAGCIKADIEEITGWPRGQIDYALRKWDLVMPGSASHWATNDVLDRAVVRDLGIEATSTATLEQSLDGTEALAADAHRSRGNGSTEAVARAAVVSVGSEIDAAEGTDHAAWICAPTRTLEAARRGHYRPLPRKTTGWKGSSYWR